jgi:hypothetical protein
MRPKIIRHSDVLIAVPGEGGRLLDNRLDGRPREVRSRFHLTRESFIK